MNVTLSVDAAVVRRVRKAAIDRNTTLAAMVRSFLDSVAEREDSRRAQAVKRMERTFERLSRDMGRRSWRREDLYER